MKINTWQKERAAYAALLLMAWILQFGGQISRQSIGGLILMSTFLASAGQQSINHHLQREKARLNVRDPIISCINKLPSHRVWIIISLFAFAIWMDSLPGAIAAAREVIYPLWQKYRKGGS